MNPFVLQIANGNIFFTGMGMTVIAFAFRLWLNDRVSISLLTITWLVGISFVILSATPLSFWLYGLWFVLCIAVRIISNIRLPSRLKVAIVVIFALFSLALCLGEIPYHLPPSITVSRDQPVFVLGDSLSAGIGTKERAWPDVLGDVSHLKVTNLAQPGAIVETALLQADGITATNALIILEIGGNDLLGHTDSHTFYVQLDNLLGKLSNGNNRVIMFELPLLPFHNAFGRAQRILANKHEVTLIPKSYMTEVFSLKDGTLDGLHLSQKGHNALANSVSCLLK